MPSVHVISSCHFMTVAARMTRTNFSRVHFKFHTVCMENPCESTGPLRLSEKVSGVHRFLHTNTFFFAIPWKWTTECFETDCGHNLWIEICFENIELLLSTYAQFWNFNVLHKQLFLVTNYKRDISHFLVVSPLFDCPLCYPVVLPRCVIPLCCPVPAGSKSSSRSPVVSPREMRNEKHTDDKQYFISTYFIQQHQYHSIPKFQYHGWKRMNINVSYFVGEGLGGMFS